MKKFKFTKFLSIIISICFVLSGVTFNICAKDLDLKIVYTNDIHGRIAKLLKKS